MRLKCTIPSHGIRQGDILSPTLFTLLLDLLSRMLSRAKNKGKISGINVSQISHYIIHLMYADDLVFYCKADEIEAQEIKRCLNLYCFWIGQCINYENSDVHFSPNVRRAVKNGLCRMRMMRECSHNRNS